MRHFDFLTDAERRRLLVRAPEEFDAGADPRLLAVALGATLYLPAIRPHLGEDISRRAREGVTSMVACLEDAIADADVVEGERNLVAELHRAAGSGADMPLLFVRVRNPEQISMIVTELGEDSRLLTGFVLPKFTEDHGPEYLDAVVAGTDQVGHKLFAMPVIESREIMFVETRTEALHGARAVLDKYRDHILAVRVGATDLSEAYGLRRSRDLTIYDVRMVADVIADIVNVFGRADTGYIVTGPVWEYFSRSERIFKPQLRASPFVEHSERALRAQLIAADLDGLIREVALDRANGLVGKTVIHPSHVAAVHALSVVTSEEFADASDIIASGACGGASASSYRNKMNESKPHMTWAHRTVLRSRAFGVAREGVSFVDLLGAGLNQ
jgi:citrate lyase beta subunit